MKPYWQMPQTYKASELPIVVSPRPFPMDRTSARLKSRWGSDGRDLNLVDGDPVDDDPEATLARETRVHQECLHLGVIT